MDATTFLDPNFNQNNAPWMPNRDEKVQYNDLVHTISHNFTQTTRLNTHLYYATKTGSMELFDIFLDFLPEHMKQHYNCNTCRHFINKYGRLVYIDPTNDYKLKSACFGLSDEEIQEKIAEPFRDSYKFMRNSVECGNISYPFEASDTTLGTPYDGYFNHFNLHIRYAGRAVRDIISRRDLMYKMLKRDIKFFEEDTIKRAKALFNSGSLNNPRKYIPILERFTDLKKEFDKVTDEAKLDRMYWYYSADYEPIKNTVLDRLLCMIRSSVYSTEGIVREFNKLTDGLHYQRPTAMPSTNSIIEADKAIRELGYADSLRRRFCNIEDIPDEVYIWKPKMRKREDSNVSVFNDILNKAKANEIPHKATYADVVNDRASAELITFKRFLKDVVENAQPIAMEYCPYYNDRNLCGLTTQAVENAKPIFKWDTDDIRNPISWYLYANGQTPGTWNIYNDAPITGIFRSPNKWYGSEACPDLDAYILPVTGVKDTRLNGGLGLFPEFLKGDLFQHRKTIEYFSGNSKIENFENPTCAGGLIFYDKRGIGYNTIILVHTPSYSKYYKIAMFD